MEKRRASEVWAAVMRRMENLNTNATAHRRLGGLEHHLHRSGTFCLGAHLAPLVMLLGCQRCGTGSLYESVMTHISGARRGHALHGEAEYYGREMHFFATDAWSKGVNHYLSHFPTCPHDNSRFEFTVDATPAYLRKPIVTSRIRDVYPSAVMPHMRFLVILRDPVERLHAYWDTFVQSGAGTNDFNTWTILLLDKVKTCQRAHGDELWPPPDTGRCDADVLEGIATGLYHNQMAYWFKQFTPARFLVTTLDAYERSTGSVLRDISGFLGVTTALLGTAREIGTPTNVQAVKTMGGPPATARTALGKFYYPHNQHLKKFFEGQPHARYSPSLQELGIGSWTSG